VDKIMRCTLFTSLLLPLLVLSTRAQPQVRLLFADSAVVNDTLIRLGDIATIADAPPHLRATLGTHSIGEAAPAGYSRFVDSRELCLNRLAAQFPQLRFVDEHPVRMRVRTAGVHHTIAEYGAAIEEAFLSRVQWPAHQIKFSIVNSADSWISLEGPLSVTVEGPEDGRCRGAVQLWLRVVSAQGQSVRLAVRCKVSVSAEVLVAARTIARDEAIGAEDFRVELRDITRCAFEPLSSAQAVVGMRARRTLVAGTLLDERMVQRIPAVRSGEPVRLRYQGGRVDVSVEAMAREDGCVGENVWVENRQSNRLVRGTVVARGCVAVQRGDNQL
jgi:flagella basal body P-ring formation protein FlgA